jgi:2-amino-4-hydroxy-6-hydroxymethyldihydropteridine diphosphokinase
MNHTAYIGLGANLPSPAGSPRQTLAAALAALGGLGIVSARSSFYETAPVGYTAQPSFLNAVAQLETELAPEPLLAALLAIEQRFGRDRASSPCKGPRTLDLDLLLFDDAILSTPTLTLPHPELAGRRFVLAPLAEIAPTLRHPILGKNPVELLALLPETGENSAAAVRAFPAHPTR